MAGPNPIKVLFSILRARRLSAPRPEGDDTIDHSAFDEILSRVASGGVDAIDDVTTELETYAATLADTDPDRLTRSEALAYWINLYNAHALLLAHEAHTRGLDSVLGVGNGFDGPVTTVGGEALSLEGIEHGKIRRFGDPRIHAVLVCGSVSCPTLRYEAYRGPDLEAQLEDQMRHFLSSGAFVLDREAKVGHLSRVFLWYGADFVRPHRMPTLLPAPKRAIGAAVTAWLSPEDAAWIAETRPRMGFQKYDWGLACSVRDRPGD